MKKTSTTNVAPTGLDTLANPFLFLFLCFYFSLTDHASAARTAVPTRAALAEITNTAAAIVAQQIDGKKVCIAITSFILRSSTLFAHLFFPPFHPSFDRWLHCLIHAEQAVTARAVAPAVAPTGVAAGGVARRTRAAVAAGAALSQTQTQTQHAHHHAVEVHQEQHFISANAATSGVYDGSVVRPAAVEQHDEEMEVVSNAPIGYGYQDRPANIEDIDEGDVHDPIFCSEYVKEIFTYLLQKEVC